MTFPIERAQKHTTGEREHTYKLIVQQLLPHSPTQKPIHSIGNASFAVAACWGLGLLGHGIHHGITIPKMIVLMTWLAAPQTCQELDFSTPRKQAEKQHPKGAQAT